MNTDKHNEYVTRDAILKLLSDNENARVSTMEDSGALATGDEYVDLEHLNHGVVRMQATTKVKMGEVLPRSAVADKTWTKICALLATAHRA